MVKTTIAVAAATLVVMGVSSAYADGGNVHADTQFTEMPGVMAHSLRYTGSVAADNMGHAVSFMAMKGQYTVPPGYKLHYDRAEHVVMLRYAHRLSTNNQPVGHTVSFMAMKGQYTVPPGYKLHYDRAEHVVTLRYAHRVNTNSNNG